MPEKALVKAELQREKNKLQNRGAVTGTFLALVTIVLIAVLVSLVWVPAMRVTGGSMEPTLRTGDVVLIHKQETVERGELLAFNYGNKLLIKRCIAKGGDMVNIKLDGSVYVNGEKLDEPYVEFSVLGDSNIEFPYQVPEGRYFVLGDHRATSVDSRSTAIGCVSLEQVVGTVGIRVWPLYSFGKVD